MSKTSTKTNTLLLVDVQKDFHPGGSLAIPSAQDDAVRIAQFIDTHHSSIDRIVATLDTHQKLHIAHPCFWWSADGSKHPDPFTIISSDDVRQGVWQPRSDLNLDTPDNTVDPSVFADIESVQECNKIFDLTRYCLEYTLRLERAGRFQLCIWPEHCLIGSPGHAVVDVVRDALDRWSDHTGASVEWIHKGQHILTEMYSALCADVPVSLDTAFATDLHGSLLQSHPQQPQQSQRRLLVCGQASSHCVNYTTRDIVDRWPVERRHEICVLRDCTSAVPGFEAAADTFYKDMASLNVEIRTSTDPNL